MAQNNFLLDLIASLKKSASKKQIKADIKSLGDIKFDFPVASEGRM